MTVVGVLRRNDPDIKYIHIFLLDEAYETSDAELARALEENPFVTEIDIDPEGDLDVLGYNEEPQWPDWNSFLRVIATRANLEKVALHRDVPYDERRCASAGVDRSILRAIQQNTSVRCVDLMSARLPADVSTFLDNASSITSLKLYACDMEPGEREQGASSLAAALQRNTNIETLELNSLEDIYALPILESLRSNTSLKTFIWEGGVWDEELALALQRLLESTTSIQTIELDDPFVQRRYISTACSSHHKQ